jgi:hypothetical protein
MERFLSNFSFFEKLRKGFAEVILILCKAPLNKGLSPLAPQEFIDAKIQLNGD